MCKAQSKKLLVLMTMMVGGTIPHYSLQNLCKTGFEKQQELSLGIRNFFSISPLLSLPVQFHSSFKPEPSQWQSVLCSPPLLLPLPCQGRRNCFLLEYAHRFCPKFFFFSILHIIIYLIGYGVFTITLHATLHRQHVWFISVPAIHSGITWRVCLLFTCCLNLVGNK